MRCRKQYVLFVQKRVKRCPISYNKKITGNLKNSIVFFRFITTFSEYSIILFKTVWNESNFRDMAVLNQISQELQLGRFAEYT